MSDTPRTDALHFGYKDDIGMQRHELLKLSRTLERELVEAKDQLRLCNVDQFTTAAELAEAVAKERERCAKVCDEMDESFVTIYGTDYTDFQNDPRYLQMAADAIRKGE